MIPTIYNWSTREGGGFYGQIKDHPLLVQGCWVEIHIAGTALSGNELMQEPGT